MQKAIIISSFFFLCNITINAQSDPRFGFRVGLNVSNQEFMLDDIHIEPQSKLGLDLAVVSDFPLGPVVSFAPEFHWLQKGFKADDLEIQGHFFDLKSTLNYFELPLLVKFNFGEAAKFFVMAGPSIGYMFSDHTEDGEGNEVHYQDFLEDDISRFEVGAHLGAGFGWGPIVVDLRYILGITNLINEIPEAEIHNTSFGGGVSVMF